MLVEISNGELVDKFTILKIKRIHAFNIPDKLRHINAEIDVLESYVKALNVPPHLIVELETVNMILWGVEDDIRQCEKNQHFGTRFVELARTVYRTNDVRFAIKCKINEATKSTIKEQKILPEYE